MSGDKEGFDGSEELVAKVPEGDAAARDLAGLLIERLITHADTAGVLSIRDGHIHIQEFPAA